MKDVLEQMRDDLLDFVNQHGFPKIGRWVYCKYCYKSVRPIADYSQGIVKCSRCGAGLAPLEDVVRAGSYQKWEEKIELDYARMMKYLDEIREGTREPDGMDEYGIVPYICPHCKKRQITVHSSKGNFCKECVPPKP